jgi:hypothetical protein
MQIKERKMNAIGSEQTKSTDLDRFVSEQNIARYRILFDPKQTKANGERSSVC